tara:strand:+ start:255 stop:479 length:225 start_codon:yes stop_codon:yes gene_type:complete
MARKGTKGKPTRKDITDALRFIGQKLKFLEDLSVAQENILDSYIEFKEDKDKFLEFLEKKYPKKEKEVESTAKK